MAYFLVYQLHVRQKQFIYALGEMLALRHFFKTFPLSIHQIWIEGDIVYQSITQRSYCNTDCIVLSLSSHSSVNELYPQLQYNEMGQKGRGGAGLAHLSVSTIL